MIVYGNLSNKLLGNNGKQCIFCDVDDVILMSSKAMIELINAQYRRPYGLKDKTYEDLHDWRYKSIYRGKVNNDENEGLSPEIVEQMFDSDDFWNLVEFNPGFLKMFDNEKIVSGYNWILVTKGNELNLEKKKEFLFNNNSPISHHKENFIYYGLQLNECKSKVNMKGGIQIDDRFDNLEPTNAKLKILMKNGLTTDYNASFGNNRNLLPNLYIINYFDELEQILEFNLEYPLNFDE